MIRRFGGNWNETEGERIEYGEKENRREEQFESW